MSKNSDDTNRLFAEVRSRKVSSRNSMSPELRNLLSDIQGVVSLAVSNDMAKIAERANFIASILISKKQLKKRALEEAAAMDGEVPGPDRGKK